MNVRGVYWTAGRYSSRSPLNPRERAHEPRSLVRILREEAGGEEGDAARGPPPTRRRALPTTTRDWNTQRALHIGPSLSVVEQYGLTSCLAQLVNSRGNLGAETFSRVD